jgi:hypothetical protein
MADDEQGIARFEAAAAEAKAPTVRKLADDALPMPCRVRRRRPCAHEGTSA